MGMYNAGTCVLDNRPVCVCVIMSIAGVLSWKDCLDYTPAWDTLIWFSVLMSMCR